MCLYKGPVQVPLLFWERIIREIKEEVKEVLRREKRQYCIRKVKLKEKKYEKSTKPKVKEESLKKKKCGEMTELKESKRKEQEQ